MIKINKNSLTKDEIIRSKKEIDFLFKNAIKLYTENFYCNYNINNKNDEIFEVDDISVKSLFVVPKKLHSLSVTRNLLKRRIKESYRLNKNEIILLCKKFKSNLRIIFVYKNINVNSYYEINKEMVFLINKIENEIIKI